MVTHSRITQQKEINKRQKQWTKIRSRAMSKLVYQWNMNEAISRTFKCCACICLNRRSRPQMSDFVVLFSFSFFIFSISSANVFAVEIKTVYRKRIKFSFFIWKISFIKKLFLFRSSVDRNRPKMRLFTLEISLLHWRVKRQNANFYSWFFLFSSKWKWFYLINCCWHNLSYLKLPVLCSLLSQKTLFFYSSRYFFTFGWISTQFTENKFLSSVNLYRFMNTSKYFVYIFLKIVVDLC